MRLHLSFCAPLTAIFKIWPQICDPCKGPLLLRGVLNGETDLRCHWLSFKLTFAPTCSWQLCEKLCNFVGICVTFREKCKLQQNLNSCQGNISDEGCQDTRSVGRSHVSNATSIPMVTFDPGKYLPSSGVDCNSSVSCLLHCSDSFFPCGGQRRQCDVVWLARNWV